MPANSPSASAWRTRTIAPPRCRAIANTLNATNSTAEAARKTFAFLKITYRNMPTTIPPQRLDATPEDGLAKPSNAKELNVALSGLANVDAIAFGLGGAQLHLPAAIALALLPGVLIFLVHREPLVYGDFQAQKRSAHRSLNCQRPDT
jgi:hypothetical protein